MDKDEALKYLDWYFYNDSGMADKAAVKYYEELKELIEHLEQYTDRFCKINIYLLRKYQKDLLKEFNCETNDFMQWMFLINIFDKIAAKMNEEMPEFWYKYGFGQKINN